MSIKLKVGDIVQLKSGGPKMTILTIAEDEPDDNEYKVRAAWFVPQFKDNSDRVKKEWACFPLTALKLCDD